MIAEHAAFYALFGWGIVKLQECSKIQKMYPLTIFNPSLRADQNIICDTIDNVQKYSIL